MSETTWTQRLFGGMRRTSEKLGENLGSLTSGGTTLDARTLDDVEDALVASDLGPATAKTIRDRLAETKFDRGVDAQGVRAVMADEIAKVLRPVAHPIEIDAFPRPQVILVIGVNGSGKTTTIAKLAHYFLEQDYGVMLAAGDTFRAAAIGQLKSGQSASASRSLAAPKVATQQASFSTRSRKRPKPASTSSLSTRPVAFKTSAS
jgi:fused signal recognition particle receptor